MLVKLFGAAVQGIDATIVTIEVNCSRGIKFYLVGLPDSAVKESHERNHIFPSPAPAATITSCSLTNLFARLTTTDCAPPRSQRVIT